MKKILDNRLGMVPQKKGFHLCSPVGVSIHLKEHKFTYQQALVCLLQTGHLLHIQEMEMVVKG